VRNKFLGTGYSGFRPLRKLRIMLSGLRYAVLYDFSVAYKVVLSVLILGVGLYFHQWLDVLLVFVATGLMMIAEMFNTSIEALCDFVEGRMDDRIRVIKDIAAAAVGISILVWAIVIVVETGRMLMDLNFIKSTYIALWRKL
jgi:diacylglycerol kinase (ATP)